MLAVAVENDGASAVTSQEKFPDNPKPTFRMTTWVLFDSVSWKKRNCLKNIWQKKNTKTYVDIYAGKWERFAGGHFTG